MVRHPPIRILGLVIPVLCILFTTGANGQPGRSKVAPAAIRTDAPVSTSPRLSSNVNLIRAVEGGSFKEIAVAGDVVYAGLWRFLVTIDVSNKSNPTRISNLLFPYDTQIADIVLAGNYAYVADADSGLRVIDISDPANLIEVGAATGGDVMSVAVSGSHAYVARGRDGFGVLDISDPTNPFEVGSVATAGWPWRVVVQGNYAYVWDASDGELEVFNVADPSSPYLEGSWNSPTSLRDLGMDVSGSYVYIAHYDLWIVDVSDPANPALAASLRLEDQGGDVDVQGNYAYVTNQSAFEVVDVSVPTSPTAVGSTLAGEGERLVVDGNYAFVGGSSEGVKIIDIADTSYPTETSRFRAVRSAQSACEHNGLVYMTDTEGFFILDVSNPLDPIVAVGVPTHFGVSTYDLVVSGTTVYLANCDTWYLTWGGLMVYDMTNPDSIGFGYSLKGCLTAVDASGDYAYAGGGDTFDFDDFIVYDVSDPSNPTVIATYNTNQRIHAIALSGPHAYLGAEDGLRVMDISDPANPTEAATFGFGGHVSDIVIEGSYAYLATGSTPPDAMLRVIDVSNPTAPAEIGSYSTGVNGNAISLFGDYVYVTTFSGLYIVQVSDPANPVEIGLYTDEAIAGRAVAAPPFFYAATPLTSGFNILQLEVPTSIPGATGSLPALHQNYPNPFNPTTTISFTLARRSAVELLVYDVKGELVATIIDDVMNGGPHSVTWDGRDGDGNEVSSGVYFYRLNAGGRRTTKKLVLLR
ncbi:MAG: FlgD immunoglobulin-like domain containing protein [Candidatus Krumholzibacteria bacterium]